MLAGQANQVAEQKLDDTKKNWVWITAPRQRILSFTLPDFKSIQPRILFSTSKKLRFNSHMGLGFFGFQTQITEANVRIENTL